MSTLTEALDRIFIRLQQKGRLTTSFLPPGLNLAEIEEITENLPIRLPQEVYELYQWSRGFELDGVYETLCNQPGPDAYFFNGYTLISLPDVVKIYRERFKDSKYYYEYQMERSNHNWIQIFMHYMSEHEGYVIIDSKLKTGGVVFAHHKDLVIDNKREEQYVSLTSMMQTLAEQYERRDLSSGELAEIWRKYNSSIADAVVAKLTDDISYRSLIEIAEDLMKVKDPRAVEPLIHVLQKPVPCTEELGKQQLAASILGEIGDARAVEPLICALQDDYWMTRYSAAVALGQLKDERATVPLTNALQDSFEKVRRMAGLALVKLKAVDSLIQALQHFDGRVRKEAARALGEIKDPKAVEYLSQLTEDEDSEIRGAAILTFPVKSRKAC